MNSWQRQIIIDLTDKQFERYIYGEWTSLGFLWMILIGLIGLYYFVNSVTFIIMTIFLIGVEWAITTDRRKTIIRLKNIRKNA